MVSGLCWMSNVFYGLCPTSKVLGFFYIAKQSIWSIANCLMLHSCLWWIIGYVFRNVLNGSGLDITRFVGLHFLRLFFLKSPTITIYNVRCELWVMIFFPSNINSSISRLFTHGAADQNWVVFLSFLFFDGRPIDWEKDGAGFPLGAIYSSYLAHPM